jgi:hypothetical protein
VHTLTLHTANGVQELVTDWKQIAVHYLRGFFFLDVLASVWLSVVLLACSPIAVPLLFVPFDAVTTSIAEGGGTLKGN